MSGLAYIFGQGQLTVYQAPLADLNTQCASSLLLIDAHGLAQIKWEN